MECPFFYQVVDKMHPPGQSIVAFRTNKARSIEDDEVFRGNLHRWLIDQQIESTPKCYKEPHLNVILVLVVTTNSVFGPQTNVHRWWERSLLKTPRNSQKKVCHFWSCSTHPKTMKASSGSRRLFNGISWKTNVSKWQFNGPKHPVGTYTFFICRKRQFPHRRWCEICSSPASFGQIQIWSSPHRHWQFPSHVLVSQIRRHGDPRKAETGKM